MSPQEEKVDLHAGCVMGHQQRHMRMMQEKQWVIRRRKFNEVSSYTIRYRVARVSPQRQIEKSGMLTIFSMNSGRMSYPGS